MSPIFPLIDMLICFVLVCNVLWIENKRDDNKTVIEKKIPLIYISKMLSEKFKITNGNRFLWILGKNSDSIKEALLRNQNSIDILNWSISFTFTFKPIKSITLYKNKSGNNKLQHLIMREKNTWFRLELDPACYWPSYY